MLVQKTVLFVGDGACGKTYLYLAYTKEEFANFCIPTIYDFFHADVEVDGTYVELLLIDSAGIEEMHKLREVIYKTIQPDVILIGFSVILEGQLRNVDVKWLPHIKTFFPNVPLILVGLQTDLRNDPHTLANLQRREQKVLAFKDGLKMAKKINAVHYIECSARNKSNVDKVFEIVAKVALRKESESKPNCHLM